MISFKIDTKGLEDKLDKLTRIDKERIYGGVGAIIEKNVVRKIDELGIVDSGTFKASVSHTVHHDYVMIHDGVKYGAGLEFGTRPHVITPKNKQALSFEWGKAGGKVVFRKVMHPGTKAYAPFRKGLISSQVEVAQFVRQSIINVAR